MSDIPLFPFSESAGVLLFDGPAVRSLLTPELCLAALEAMYIDLHAAPADGGRSLGFETNGGKIHVKAGLTPRTHRYFAAKINANYPANPERFGLPTIQGLILLCVCDDGRPVAILDSAVLTGLRTAAATALAARHGARGDSRTLAMIGAGAQARYQIEAVCGVRRIERVLVADLDRARAQAAAAAVRDDLGVDAEAADEPARAVGACDICITSTTSTSPLFGAEIVPAGCFVAAVGADSPDKQEIAPELFARARIIVDDRRQCAVSGDLAHALRAGTVCESEVVATLAQLAAGAIRARRREEDIVLFDSTGVGVQDVAAAAAVYEAAVGGE